MSGAPTSGAFYSENAGNGQNDGSASIMFRYLGFNANSSNSVYTDNGKVLPLSISKQSYIIYK